MQRWKTPSSARQHGISITKTWPIWPTNYPLNNTKRSEASRASPSPRPSLKVAMVQMVRKTWCWGASSAILLRHAELSSSHASRITPDSNACQIRMINAETRDAKRSHKHERKREKGCTRAMEMAPYEASIASNRVRSSCMRQYYISLSQARRSGHDCRRNRLSVPLARISRFWRVPSTTSESGQVRPSRCLPSASTALIASICEGTE